MALLERFTTGFTKRKRLDVDFDKPKTDFSTSPDYDSQRNEQFIVHGIVSEFDLIFREVKKRSSLQYPQALVQRSCLNAGDYRTPIHTLVWDVGSQKYRISLALLWDQRRVGVQLGYNGELFKPQQTFRFYRFRDAKATDWNNQVFDFLSQQERSLDSNGFPRACQIKPLTETLSASKRKIFW